MPFLADGTYQLANDQSNRLWTQRRNYEQLYVRKKQQKLPEQHGTETESLSRNAPDLQPKFDLKDEDIESLLKDTDSTKIDIDGVNESTSYRFDNKHKGHNYETKANQEAEPMAEQHQKEPTAICTAAASHPRPAAILLPGQFDVLLGRGAGYHCHSGNVRLRGIIEPKVPAHTACSTSEEKVAMTLAVLQEVHAKGGRFLKQGSEGWIAVSDHEARQKVGHTFRNMRMSARKHQNKTKTAIKRTHPEGVGKK